MRFFAGVQPNEKIDDFLSSRTNVEIQILFRSDLGDISKDQRLGGMYKWQLPCLMIYTNRVSMVKTMQATRKVIKIIVTEIIVTEICSHFRR